jgi:hypothetical protein
MRWSSRAGNVLALVARFALAVGMMPYGISKLLDM